MSDFIARVTAELDTSKLQSQLNSVKNLKASLNQFEVDASGLLAQLRGSLNKEKFSIKLDGIDLGNVWSEANAAGLKIGKSLTDSITKSVDTGKIQSSIAALSAQYQKLLSSSSSIGGSFGSSLQVYGASIDWLKSKLIELNKAVESGDTDAMVSSYTSLNQVLERTRNRLSTLSSQQSEQAAKAKENTAAAKAQAQALKENEQAAATLSKSSTLSNNMQAWLNNNTKAAKVFGAEIQDLKAKLNQNDDPAMLREVSLRFAEIKSEANAAGLTVSSFATALKNTVLQVAGLTSGVMVLRKALSLCKEGVQTIIDLDTALVDLRKTSTASASELNDYFFEANESAKKLGVTTQEIIQSAADWSRLGFSLEDSKTMAEVSAKFEAISPDLDMSSAVDGLVSAMKANYECLYVQKCA